MMQAEDAVEAGRDAFRRRDWKMACAAFESADAREPLDTEDLERWAATAYLVGEEHRFVQLMSRIHREAMRAGDAVTAAHAAFWVAFSFFDRGEAAQANGWLQRGQVALGEEPGSSTAQGYLLALEAIQLITRGRAVEGLEMFTEVHACGLEFADVDLVALGRLGQGQALVLLGEVEKGSAYLDEVMVAVTAEELSAVVSGLVYCQVIETCHQTFDVGRAREWTGALTRWCEAQPDLVPYRGDCLVHRAQILQLNGDWELALREAEHAGRLLATLPRNPLQGAALYEEAEVHRLRGELSRAEDCYRLAGEWGHEVQPGLALLRLAQGRLDAARAGISRALDETGAPIIRPRLLAALVDIALAAGDVAGAREAADELGAVARPISAPFLRALAAQAEAAVLLAEGRPSEALIRGRSAWSTWQKLNIPFEAARSRVVVGQASSQIGDLDAAAVELEAARRAFEELHAVTELRALTTAASGASNGAGLTRREVEVLRLVAEGKTNRAIAAELVLSEKTVARHLANIFVKLDLSSRAAATAYAFQHDLV
jgi:DNA-binding CsgD family transcriptional regulator